MLLAWPLLPLLPDLLGLAVTLADVAGVEDEPALARRATTGPIVSGSSGVRPRPVASWIVVRGFLPESSPLAYLDRLTHGATVFGWWR